MHSMNVELDRMAFAALVMDHEYQEDKDLGLAAMVTCRVLVDGWWVADLCARDRAEAVDLFRSGAWKN